MKLYSIQQGGRYEIHYVGIEYHSGVQVDTEDKLYWVFDKQWNDYIVGNDTVEDAIDFIKRAV